MSVVVDSTDHDQVVLKPGRFKDALGDVLRLSRAMAYKAACAGLDLGGGKAVIIGDPAELKTEPLLRAYGRFVESRFVTGRTRAHGGAGDSSVLTAYGVFQAMRAAAAHTWGASSLRGRRVGVAGAGKVGRRLVEHLLGDGASVVVADVAASCVVVNSGGLIQVADEIAGFNEQRARARAEKIFDTSQRILATTKDRDLTPAEAADHATASALGGAALCL